jgi:GAF domain-containing protein
MLPVSATPRLATLPAAPCQLNGPEPLFTEVVTLSALLFSVPTAVLAFVEDSDLLYQATYGPLSASVEAHIAPLCRLVARQQQAVTLPNLAQVPGFVGEAAGALPAPSLRFYAGIPLALPGHPCLGTLCVLDEQPRRFEASDRQVLTQLAQVAVRFLVIRQHCLTSWTEAAAYWRIVQEELRQEMRTLLALVRLRLEAQRGLPEPVPTALLEVVDQQLNALSWRLADYYPGLL